MLWFAFVALNTFVYSFSSMKGLAHVRIAFLILAPVLLAAWYLALVRHQPRNAVVWLMIWCLLGSRFFYGRLAVVSNILPCKAAQGTTINAVVFTEVDSKRTGFVEQWFDQHITGIPLTVHTDNPPAGTYKKELGYTVGCEEPMLYYQHMITYVYRYRKFLTDQLEEPADDDVAVMSSKNKKTGQEWWLIMENDAEMVYPKTFQHQLECLTTYSDVDVVFLDFRNIASDLPFIVYAGFNGVLVRREAFPRFIRELAYNPEACRKFELPMSPDALIGLACKQGRLKCIAHPMLVEHGFPSSLDYGRDTVLGEQKSESYEWAVTNAISLLVVTALYWKRRAQWKVMLPQHRYSPVPSQPAHAHDDA